MPAFSAVLRAITGSDRVAIMTVARIDSLARRLHDGIGGSLATITTLAHYGGTLDDTARCRDAFAQIARLSGRGVTELRAFLDELKNADNG